MLNIANHQRNVNGNHDEVSPHSGKNGYHQEVYKQQMLEKTIMEKNIKKMKTA